MKSRYLAEKPLLACLALGAALGTPLAFAQTSFPARSISMIVPFAPGGTSDIVARLVAAKMSEDLGKTVIVENRVGGGGNIGASYVVRAKADGYTVLLANNAITTNPATQKTSFDPDHDFSPVALIGSIPIALAVHPSVPAKSVAELIRAVKASPKAYAFSSCGAGTAQHFAGELLNQRAGIDLVHVAYKGCSPAVTDGVSGQVPIMFNAIGNLMPYAKSGQLRILAVASSEKFQGDKGIQTMAEAGFDNFDAEVWFGLLAPASTPADIVERLHSAVGKAVKDPDVRAKLETMYFQVNYRDGTYFKKYIADDFSKWKALVRDAKIDVTP